MKLRQAINAVQHDHPAYGWAAVGATVLVTDLTASRSMSDAFRTASRNPVLGPALFLGWGYLSAHLFGFIPAKFDLFHHVSHVAGKPCRHNCVTRKQVETALSRKDNVWHHLNTAACQAMFQLG